MMFILIFFLSYFSFLIGMTSIFRTWYFFLIFSISGFLVAAVIIFISLLISLLILKYIKYTNKVSGYLVKSVSRFINLFLNIHVESINNEYIPKDGPTCLYGNHKSMVDPFLVSENLKRAHAFTPKGSLYKIPLLRNFLDYIGCLKIDRESDRNTLKELNKAIKRVNEGLLMTVFPEGGIKDRDDDTMKEVRAGAYKIAYKSESTIVPFTIIGNSNIHKNTPFRKTKIKVIYHEPIKYEEYKDMTTFELAQHVFDIINKPLIENETTNNENEKDS